MAQQLRPLSNKPSNPATSKNSPKEVSGGAAQQKTLFMPLTISAIEFSHRQLRKTVLKS
jgi:hypothetical protein